MSETHLSLRDVSEYCELFVDELGSSYSVSGFDSIICGEVVILAGVEDDSAVSDDYTGHELVYQSSLHIDVSEKNSVNSVVQHYVKSFKSSHCSDLRHAHSGGIVAESDISANLFANFVKSFSHDPEVFLCSVGSTETFCGGSVRNVVKKGLSGGSDNSDDVCALTSSSLSLDNVLIDITCSYDYVEVGLRTFSDSLEVFFSLSLLHVDPVEGSLYGRLKCSGCFFLGTHGKLGDLKLACSYFLCDLLRCLACLYNCISHPIGCSCGKCACFLDLVNYDVGKRIVNFVNTVDSKKSQDRSFS